MRLTLFIATTLVVVAAGCSPALNPLPPTAEGLTGTVWQFDEMRVDFGAPLELTVTGGSIKKGLKGSYTLDGNRMVVTVPMLNMTRSGFWNGERLMIDGIIGRRIE